MSTHPPGSSVPVTPSTVDPAFEARWSEWLMQCREHDREGLRRLRLSLLVVVAIGAVIGMFFGMPWSGAR
jgi:hypothetical protein